MRSTLVDNPDVVDDFFELCGKVLRFQPQILLESELLTPAFQCGCVALHLQVVAKQEDIGRCARPTLCVLLAHPSRPCSL